MRYGRGFPRAGRAAPRDFIPFNSVSQVPQAAEKPLTINNDNLAAYCYASEEDWSMVMM